MPRKKKIEKVFEEVFREKAEEKVEKAEEKVQVEQQPQTQVQFEIQPTTWEEFEKFGAKKKSKYKELAETIVNEILKSDRPLIFKIPEKGLILSVIQEINRYNAMSQSAKIVFKASYKEKTLIAGVRKL